jgi:phage terminase large subunit GpA-like protein
MSIDTLFQITCGHCGMTSPIDNWVTRPITGPLPHGTYQCPHCSCAFERRAKPNARSWERGIELAPVNPSL